MRKCSKCLKTLFFPLSDGLTVSCDISSDEELFMGQGDYQFEIYRLMKKENKFVLQPQKDI